MQVDDVLGRKEVRKVECKVTTSWEDGLPVAVLHPRHHTSLDFPL